MICMFYLYVCTYYVQPVPVESSSFVQKIYILRTISYQANLGWPSMETYVDVQGRKPEPRRARGAIYGRSLTGGSPL